MARIASRDLRQEVWTGTRRCFCPEGCLEVGGTHELRASLTTSSAPESVTLTAAASASKMRLRLWIARCLHSLLEC